MELLALFLFIAIIVSWMMLPGTTTTRMASQHESADERSPATVGQPA